MSTESLTNAPFSGITKMAQDMVKLTNTAIILIDVQNQGGSQRWGQHFPNMTAEQLYAVDEPMFLHFDELQKAIEAFELLMHDSSESEDSLVYGTISLIHLARAGGDEVTTIEWHLDDKHRLAYSNGAWENILIASRI